MNESIPGILAAATDQSALISDSNIAQATVLGAAIAGGTALVAALLTVAIQRHSLSRAERLAAKQETLSRIERQIDELYGPLLLIRRQSGYLWSKLREGKAEADWRLLNHLDEVKANPAEYAIAEELVRLNDVSQDLILRHPALVHNQVLPDSFHKFLAHAGVVKVALEMGTVPGNGQFLYYPREFDKDLETAYAALLEERKNVAGGRA